MNTYWNTAWTKRDYECTNIVAIKADQLPKGYDPNVWKDSACKASSLTNLMHIGSITQNGQRFEQWGYL